MEYVFEDFIFGFLDRELAINKLKSQRSDTYLDDDRTFNLKPDLWIQKDSKILIADTKYKIIYTDASDPKKGISQNDLYQIIAYAIRFKVDTIVLFYPNTIRTHQESQTEFKIRDEWADGKSITIKAIQLPILDRNLFANPFRSDQLLSVVFDSVRSALKSRLVEILADCE